MQKIDILAPLHNSFRVLAALLHGI